MTEPPSFTLAVCAEMVFRDLPIAERIRRIDALGFEVEIWDWTRHDVDALKATGATFSSMTGYVTGTLADDAGADELNFVNFYCRFIQGFLYIAAPLTEITQGFNAKLKKELIL